MFAIEKNPSAVKILQIRNEDEWNGQVTVIHTDMRDWKPEEKLDIIISELLGQDKKSMYWCSGIHGTKPIGAASFKPRTKPN